MQRFTLLHDGSAQGWHATYLAFHIAARLGAPLQVLHTKSEEEKETLKDIAAHVETGAHAAGVVIETHLLADFTMDTLKQNIPSIDGLFLPPRLLPDGESVSLFLEAFSCPLWVVPFEAQPTDVAVLVNDPLKDAYLISYAKALSNRLEEALIAFVLDEQFDSILKPELSGIKWKSLQEFSAQQINEALEQLHIGLLILPEITQVFSKNLGCTFIIHSNTKDA